MGQAICSHSPFASSLPLLCQVLLRLLHRDDSSHDILEGSPARIALRRFGQSLCWLVGRCPRWRLASSAALALRCFGYPLLASWPAGLFCRLPIPVTPNCPVAFRPRCPQLSASFPLFLPFACHSYYRRPPTVIPRSLRHLFASIVPVFAHRG